VENGIQKNPAEFYKHLSLFWTDLIYLMSSKPQALTSVGPMRNFSVNAKKIVTELLDSNDDLVEFNKRLTGYYQQLADTWAVAQKKVNAKMPEIPNDQEQFEAYKRIWIDIFDNDFTELFDSHKFGDNYGKLVASELELSKHWEQMTNVMLQSANLPSKKEIDEVYKELHALRKRVSKLESQNKNFKLGNKKDD
jgi:poly[(R)-3-hydroxyalkanoate] polymerase subunit PhaE